MHQQTPADCALLPACCAPRPNRGAKLAHHGSLDSRIGSERQACTPDFIEQMLDGLCASSSAAAAAAAAAAACVMVGILPAALRLLHQRQSSSCRGEL
eukprot:SAG25_NODE_8425_length_423_cov_0.941358_1_plen_97_part_10